MSDMDWDMETADEASSPIPIPVRHALEASKMYSSAEFS